MMKALTSLAILLLALGRPVPAQQEKPTRRERQLEQTVQELRERVARLEKLLEQVIHSLSPHGTPKERPSARALLRSGGRSPIVDEHRQRPSPSERPMTTVSRRRQEDRRRVPGSLRAYWKEGIRLDSADGAFRLRLGGRIMNDWGFFIPDEAIEKAFGPQRDGTEFRRARLYVSGTLYDRVEFKAQYDFAGGQAAFKDVYLGLINLPVIGHVRIGHFKEPFSLEELTSSKYITFMERSLSTVFAPSRNTGLMFHNHALDERLTWAIGVFREADRFGAGAGDGKYNLTGRVTGLPWYREDGRKLLHLGLGYSHRKPVDGLLRLRERPEAHLASRFVDTSAFAVTSVDVVGLEGALVYGPFSLQSEYIRHVADRPIGPDPDFYSYYVQASYFLTGEHRRYKRSTGAFDRIRPRRSFGLGDRGGTGAWEIAARYSDLDLTNGGIDGGRLQDMTLGVNWYLNPNTRLMWNYVFADRADLGNASILQMRLQVDF